ncbi:MAG TPA: tRNA uridine-5-carboxymethylaminomethyl(34) synthesis GTPase MnmE [Rickettsiales bacterium]|nr:tRNA uridine-5-carboxymethylaminomethyl(34) synthesis GTPase MnmE [Rickettsiales bacterium]
MTTIFAPITNINNCAVVVVRISGDRALWSLQQFGIKNLPKANEIKFAKIFDPKTSELIDEVVVSYFQAPHSFTGQDVVEIAFHASKYILKKILTNLAEFNDFYFAQVGEFSKLAFLNNKIDLVQAEAVLDLINAETESQHKQALAQLQGKLGKIYEDWKAQIIEILALIESFIDFPDEDLPAEIIDQASNKVIELATKISAHLDDNKRGQKIKDGLSLAIIGAPNVGKSTLLNFLAKSEVAIVSDIAGTTRDVIEVHLDISGVAVKIADTAGIRESVDKIEQEGIKRALKKAQEADLKIILFDRISQIKSEKNTIRVLNKIDLFTDFDTNDFDVVISLKTGENLDLFISKLEEEVKKIIPNQNQNFITQERYRISLQKALHALENFSLEKNIELAAEDLRIAAYEIAKISGRIAVDDILDIVFSKFCIGK